MDEARALMEDYESELPLDRQIEIMATSPAQKEAETIAIAGAMLDKRRDDDQDEDEDEDAEVMSFAGGERLWDVADPIADVLKQRVTELPGCQRMSIRYDLPIRS